MSATEEEQVKAGEAARIVGVARGNLYKWLDRRGIEPVAYAEEVVGALGGGTRRPALYDRAQLVAARDQWLAERDRGSDEKRRASALARSAEREG